MRSSSAPVDEAMTRAGVTLLCQSLPTPAEAPLPPGPIYGPGQTSIPATWFPKLCKLTIFWKKYAYQRASS